MDCNLCNNRGFIDGYPCPKCLCESIKPKPVDVKPEPQPI